MELLYYVFTILLVLLHVAAVTAFTGSLLKSWALGRAAGILTIVMVAFCIEHYVGFGSLKGVWILTTAASAYYLCRKWPELKNTGFAAGEIIFFIVFAYGLIWKYDLPSFYPSAERVTDMVFVGNYYSGSTLPPVDNWYPPYKFDFYYSLQHYGAALMGRIFGLPVGLCTNIAFILLMALPATLAWEIAGRFIAKRSAKVLLVAALICGGTGASIFTPLVYQPEPYMSPQANSSVILGRMWGSARFIGHYDQLANTSFSDLFQKRNESNPDLRDLPLENYGYHYFMGDYHAPMSGFFLLLLAVGLIVSLEIPRTDESGKSLTLAKQALLALTVPASLAGHTWGFPLQALMVGSWALWRQYQAFKDPSRKISWAALISGGVAGFLLLYPFLVGFTDRSDDTPFVIVHIRTPLVPFLMQWWPLLLMFGLTLFDRTLARPALYFSLMFIALMLFSEFIRVDDITVGQFERTNSTTRWWGWIWTGALVALGAPLLASKRLWVRGATTVIIASFTLMYAIQTLDFLWDVDMSRQGKLRGEYVYTREIAIHGMFKYLALAPQGIVLENSYTEAYSDSGIYSAFAVKPTLLGWPAHEIVWRGRLFDITQRRDQIRNFYAGTLQNPAEWLKANQVRYVVWNVRDAQQTSPDLQMRLTEQLRGAYAWHSFGFVNGTEIGLWVQE